MIKVINQRNFAQILQWLFPLKPPAWYRIDSALVLCRVLQMYAYMLSLFTRAQRQSEKYVKQTVKCNIFELLKSIKHVHCTHHVCVISILLWSVLFFLCSFILFSNFTFLSNDRSGNHYWTQACRQSLLSCWRTTSEHTSVNCALVVISIILRSAQVQSCENGKALRLWILNCREDTPGGAQSHSRGCVWTARGKMCWKTKMNACDLWGKWKKSNKTNALPTVNQVLRWLLTYKCVNTSGLWSFLVGSLLKRMANRNHHSLIKAMLP